MATAAPTLAAPAPVAVPSALAVASLLLLVLTVSRPPEVIIAAVRDVGLGLGAGKVDADCGGYADSAAAGLGFRGVCASPVPLVPVSAGFLVGKATLGADLFVYAFVVRGVPFVFGAGCACFGAGRAGGGGVGGKGYVACGADVSLRGGKGAVVDDVQAKGNADPGAGAAGICRPQRLLCCRCGWLWRSDCRLRSVIPRCPGRRGCRCWLRLWLWPRRCRRRSRRWLRRRPWLGDDAVVGGGAQGQVVGAGQDRCVFEFGYSDGVGDV